nr:hypothetical protein [Tanacetum cinerariifolium]GFC92127.1 hypothetical protein [Tanacetum cinerariifolium]
ADFTNLIAGLDKMVLDDAPVLAIDEFLFWKSSELLSIADEGLL